MNYVDGTEEDSTHVREAIAELVHHNSERTSAQREQFNLMAAFVAQMYVAGNGERALSWPSACGRGLTGLTDSAFAILGKISCNVSSTCYIDLKIVAVMNGYIIKDFYVLTCFTSIYISRKSVCSYGALSKSSTHPDASCRQA